LNTVYEGMNCETRALLQDWDFFFLKMLTKRVIFLIGWLGILMNLKLVVPILTSHPLASLIIPHLRVRFVVVLPTIVILVLVIFMMIVLLNCPV